MKPGHQKTSFAAGMLFFLAVISANAYTLPALPTMPVVSSPLPPNTVPMGDPAAFPEVNMDFAIETNGPFAPTWTSIAANVPGNGTPAWLRQAKFGIWFHYGPEANLASGDWSARKMYQPGTTAYNNHLANFGHPTTNGYKEVVMMDSTTGKVVATVPIGQGVDATKFDGGTQLAFCSCGDGTVTIAHEDSPDKLDRKSGEYVRCG